jgi:hypothetical protein
MGIFKSNKNNQLDALKKLSSSILQCTFSVSDTIIESLTSENTDSITWEQNYGIKKEVLCFYLHYVDRVAIQEGDKRYYAWLQDNMVQPCSEVFIKLLFNTEGAKEEFDAEEWNSRMVGECIDLYNERGQVYSTLDLTSESGFPREDTVFGMLMSNINGVLGREEYSDINLLIVIPLWLVQSANGCGLANQVRDLKKLVL